MRIRLVLVALSLTLASFLIPSSLLGQKKSQEGQLSGRQKFESEILNLRRNLAKATGLAQKMKVLNKAEKDFRSLRAREARQPDADELFFDQFLAVLAEIPRGSEFRPENCPGYKTSLIAHFEPVSEAGVRNSALKSGLEVLSEICPVEASGQKKI